jgi:hypothetical protein
LRFSETKAKCAYEPTPADLKRRADWQENKRKWPSLYSSEPRHWPTRSYYPSGHLCLEITDPTSYRWRDEHLVGRWYDRGTKQLEEYLTDAVIALAPAAAAIKVRRAEAAERARLRAEEAEHREREAARRKQAARQHEFLLKKADAYAQHQKLLAFYEFMESEVIVGDGGIADKLAATTALVPKARELNALLTMVATEAAGEIDKLPYELRGLAETVRAGATASSSPPSPEAAPAPKRISDRVPLLLPAFLPRAREAQQVEAAEQRRCTAA